jgi:fibrillin 1
MDLDEDMRSCVKIDPCHIENGGCSHYCDSATDPICYCPSGFILNKHDQVTCEAEFKCDSGFKMSPYDNVTCIDIDECHEHHDVCKNGHCKNTEGSYTCHCHAGYQLSEDNKKCIDIDECRDGASPCSHRCLNLPGTYQCLCSYGQVLMADGHTCGFDDLCELNNGGCCM